jgi:Zn-dependent protease with chaperone function
MNKDTLRQSMVGLSVIATIVVNIWALAGIAVKNSGVQTVMLTAWIVACIVAVTLLVGQYRRQRLSTS